MTHAGSRVPAHPAAPRGGEDGSSPITSLFGVAVFLVFLLFSVQVLLYLFTATVAQSAAVDGAQFGAGAAQTRSTVAAVEHAERVLGRLADDARVVSSVRTDASGEVLEVTVEVPVTPLLSAVGRGTVVRSAEARVEQ